MCCHDKAHCVYFKQLIKTVCLKLLFSHCALKMIEARGMMQKHALCVRDFVNYKIRKDSSRFIYRMWSCGCKILEAAAGFELNVLHVCVL